MGHIDVSLPSTFSKNHRRTCPRVRINKTPYSPSLSALLPSDPPGRPPCSREVPPLQVSAFHPLICALNLGLLLGAPPPDAPGPRPPGPPLTHTSASSAARPLRAPPRPRRPLRAAGVEGGRTRAAGSAMLPPPGAPGLLGPRSRGAEGGAAPAAGAGTHLLVRQGRASTTTVPLPANRRPGHRPRWRWRRGRDNRCRHRRLRRRAGGGGGGGGDPGSGGEVAATSGG